MFSKEESRLLRQEFWTSFGKSFPRKWILYDTKIKGFSFKFHFDTKKALVALDLEDDLENRINYWEKLLSMRSILEDDYISNLIFEEEYYLENGKEISRIFIPLDKKVSIHNKNSWQDTMEFFNEYMSKFEAFFEDYKEIIKN
ncbi:DUF4268 domain-containing protein [Psychroserpens sp.]|uniref:DUF4268 domain-containing protein n=1 Tax=Psychroserpens sp. TaxID=2020870 RepID=UPI001B1377D8|nr:DUF4268 domain-containing protein [Psychroserpens sp.]MBO6607320.1 DUF4268 domain-containing protein [Psychroserpens sp.]MBO6632100.1 DUF4268 domain-containing protein [Psychroserpens sp.]MBO6654604.1 DUF4268 domain-containing protein [Psychroserpens sp.]MBO6681049.1 DUF4268 domain-containing protein [Psychroserpens sp.]MBO6749996.1 DUF4268 domain-containing protein [Psychroserpens sp.]